MTRISIVLAISLLNFAGGCSFDRSWRSLARNTPANDAQSDPFAGRWEGKWISEQTGHSGALRAVIKKIDYVNYRADFDAHFLGIIRFGHGLNFTTSPLPDGAIAFEGQEDLGGLAGGVYQYKGQADGEAFSATYEASGDRGRFEMQRPEASR